ncbi:MAG: DUF2277 domain-containing protein [Polyangiaceae bacterium]
MCRNIRLLHHFEPPTTEGEIRDAAIQFVRKVSGVNAPGVADKEAFEKAVAEIAATTTALLGGLSARGPARTREGEREKARVRWARREKQMRGAE